MVRKNISILTFLIPFHLLSTFSYEFMSSYKKKEQGVAARRLSWVLKLWYLEEAHIPPTIPKNHKVRAFSEKMAAQKATQTLIYTPPLWRLYKLNTLDLSLVWFEFGRECDYIISNNWKMGEAVGISEHSLNYNGVYPNFCLWKSKAQKYPTFL